MLKRKISLTVLTTFALVLLFSVSVLAAGVSGLRAYVDVSGKFQASWTKDANTGVTGYTVTLTDVTSEPDVVIETITLASTVSTYSKVDLDITKVYTFKVVTNGGVNDTNQSTLANVTFSSNKEITSTDVDNSIGNANQTGKGITVNNGTTNTEVIKSSAIQNDGSTGTQRTHGEYQNNTNSCASCHQTHTGASKSLLFKDGVYNTCTACHDGTLGFYNVFESSNAGTFGGTAMGNMSVHLADGTVQLKAAPGGNLSANSGSWVNEFNCASCHAPHGSYSERLLHYNPNGMGLAKTTDGGIGIKGGVISEFGTLPSASAADAAKFILVRGTAQQFGLATTDIGNNDITSTKVIMVYEDKGTAYAKSSTPWLYGYVYGSPKNYFSRFYKQPTDVTGPTAGTPDGVVDSKDQMWSVAGDYLFIADVHDNELGNSEMVFNKGFIYSTTGYLDDVQTGDVGRAYTVDLDLVEIARFGDATGVPIYTSNVNTLFDSAAVGYVSGKGVAMSTYCASCHVDYLAKSGSATGTFSSAYRHTTTSDSYTCVRCHYSHGTDVEVMMDSHGEKTTDLVADGTFATIEAANAYMVDKNPSSALKRYTNMSVCWGCHTDSKAEQLKNTFSFGDNDGQTDPHGLTAQPAMPGATSPIGSNNIFAPLP